MTRPAPRVSVALCTFNGARFVEAQLASILEQDYAVSEIIVADDGSTDGTREVVRGFLEAHCGPEATWRLIGPGETPLGSTGNFVRAIRACTGDVIALSDQDDEWLPDRIRRGVEALAEDPRVQVVGGDSVLIDSDGHESGRTHWDTVGLASPRAIADFVDDPLPVLLRANRLAGMTLLMRGGFGADHVLPVPAGWQHDYWIVACAAVRGGLTVLERPLVRYRQHQSNAIGAGRTGLRARLDAFSREARRGIDQDVAQRRWTPDAVDRLLERADSRSRALVVAKAEFERRRSGFTGARWRRILPVLSMLLRGRYSRWGARGARGALFDLLASPARSR